MPRDLCVSQSHHCSYLKKMTTFLLLIRGRGEMNGISMELCTCATKSKIFE